jgi:hypothetical protein
VSKPRPAAADLLGRMNGLVATAPGAAAAAAAGGGGDLAVRGQLATVTDRPRRSGGGRRRRGDSVARRYTVDLETGLHRLLRGWCVDRDVDGSEVVRTLIGLLADPGVSERVEAELTRLQYEQEQLGGR